jgi:hypothetical protein
LLEKLERTLTDLGWAQRVIPGVLLVNTLDERRLGGRSRGCSCGPLSLLAGDSGHSLRGKRRW